ncbi:uncharacterized protein LOC114519825 [Dendronephthya gigantea]|uniref:uncharacterized protein LOC114519825 n=1 Tax=Dendronephthya gigantea TaxID=151771 RepID=UPI00106C06B6|nr:uncharacterized protein LOC114519825 [Dendronephthya gigantea]
MALMIIGIGALVASPVVYAVITSVGPTVVETASQTYDDLSSKAAEGIAVIRKTCDKISGRFDQAVRNTEKIVFWGILNLKAVGLIICIGCAKLLQDMSMNIIFQLVYVGSSVFTLIFMILIFVDFFNFFSDCTLQYAKKGVLLCRKCCHNVVEGRYVCEKISPQARRKYKKECIFRQGETLVQTLRNPRGILFDVITVCKADIRETGQPAEAFSWFPGFAWTIAECPGCNEHLKWTFTQSGRHEYSFAGLILSKLDRQS